MKSETKNYICEKCIVDIALFVVYFTTISVSNYRTIVEGWIRKDLKGNDHGLKLKTKLHILSPQANYTDRLSDRRLLAKLVPTLADRGCRVVSATIPPTVVNFGFLDRSRYSLEIAPQLSSRGWVNPVPDPLLLRKNLVAPGIQPGPLNL
jgi:hypothetical protein